MIDKNTENVSNIGTAKCCENGSHSHSHDHSAIENIQSIYINNDSETMIYDKDKLEMIFGELIWEQLEG